MMNNVSLMGRLVAEPAFQTFERDGKETAAVRYRLAVERDYKKGDMRQADFIACKSFGAEAKFVKEYYHQGDLIAVTGRIVTECYKRAGDEKNSFFTCVQVGKSYFAKRRGGEQARSRAMSQTQDGKPHLDGGHAEPPQTPEEDYGELPPLPDELLEDFPSSSEEDECRRETPLPFA